MRPDDETLMAAKYLAISRFGPELAQPEGALR
jgi:hypothetical protein